MAIIIEDEKDLYLMLISELRYAINRDNHLAPDTCIELICKYLPKMSEPLRSITAKQLANESIQERLFMLPYFKEKEYKIYSYGTDNKRQLANDELWEKLLRFLLEYLTEVPYEADRYMEHIYGHMDYYVESVKGINWDSDEIRNKIQSNAERLKKEIK